MYEHHTGVRVGEIQYYPKCGQNDTRTERHVHLYLLYIFYIFYICLSESALSTFAFCSMQSHASIQGQPRAVQSASNHALVLAQKQYAEIYDTVMLLPLPDDVVEHLFSFYNGLFTPALVACMPVFDTCSVVYLEYYRAHRRYFTHCVRRMDEITDLVLRATNPHEIHALAMEKETLMQELCIYRPQPYNELGAPVFTLHRKRTHGIAYNQHVHHMETSKQPRL